MATVSFLLFWKGYFVLLSPTEVNRVSANLDSMLQVGINGDMVGKSYTIQLLKPGGLVEMKTVSSPSELIFELPFNTGPDADTFWTVRVFEHDSVRLTTNVLTNSNFLMAIGSGGLATGYGLITSIDSPVGVPYGEEFTVNITIRNNGGQSISLAPYLGYNDTWWDAYYFGTLLNSAFIPAGSEMTFSFTPVMGTARGLMIIGIQLYNDVDWVTSDERYWYVDLPSPNWEKPSDSPALVSITLNNPGSSPVPATVSLQVGNIVVASWNENLSPGVNSGIGGGFMTPASMDKQAVLVSVNSGGDILVDKYFAGVLNLVPGLGQISGTVVIDGTVTPVEDVTVEIDGRSGISGGFGTFEILDVEPVDYQLRATKNGYETTLVNVTIVSGINELTVDLVPVVPVDRYALDGGVNTNFNDNGSWLTMAVNYISKFGITGIPVKFEAFVGGTQYAIEFDSGEAGVTNYVINNIGTQSPEHILPASGEDFWVFFYNFGSILGLTIRISLGTPEGGWQLVTTIGRDA